MRMSAKNGGLIGGIGFILALIVALSYSIGWQGGVVSFFFWVGGIFVSVPAVILALVFGKWRMAIMGGVLFAACLSYSTLCQHFAPQKTEQARKFVAEAAPYLEAYRKEHGSYPERLSALKDLASPPWYLQYRVDANGYMFLYPSWGDISCFDFWEYNSGSDHWQLHT